MTRTESTIAVGAPSRKGRLPLVAVGLVLLCVIVLLGWLLLNIPRMMRLQASAVSLQREATRMAIDRGITLCRAGQVPSGLLWLGRSLELAPPGDVDLQRIIRTNITAWTDRSYSAIDVLTHGTSVQATACNSDGSTLATAGIDGRVCVWKMPTDVNAPGAQISVFKVGDPPTAYAFDSTGKTVVTGSDDGTIRFFDVSAGIQKKLIINQAGSVSALAFSADGTFLVTGSTAGMVRRWDLKTGNLLGEASGHNDWVLSMAVSPDGKYFVSGGNDGKAKLWLSDGVRPAGPAIDLASAVTGVAFSPDGKRFMTVAGYNATIYQTATQKADGDPIRHDSALRSAAYNAAGTAIVTGCRDGYIRVWDAATHAPAAPSIRCVTAVHLVNFSPDGQSIISADDAPGVRIWRLPVGDHPTRTINAGMPVTALAFTPDGSRIVVGTSAAGDPGLPSNDGGARIYRVADGQPDSAPFATGAGIVSIAVSEDGTQLLTGGTDSYARLRSLPDLKPIGDPLYYGYRLRGVALASKFSTVVACGADAGSQGDTKIWKYDSVPSAKQRPEIIDQDQSVAMVSLSPDQKRLVTACGTGSASVWTLADAQSAHASFAHQNAATVAIFRPDGNAVLSADQNGTARLWNVKIAGGYLSHDSQIKLGAAIAPAMQNAGPVSSAAFTPDGNMAAIGTITPAMKWYGGWGTGTSTVQLWDADSGTAIGDSMRYSAWAVWRVAITPDGTTLAVGSVDGFIRFYKLPIADQLPVADVLAQLQLRLNRRMDENQTEVPIDAAGWLARRAAAH